jgi:hypothetical protein
MHTNKKPNVSFIPLAGSEHVELSVSYVFDKTIVQENTSLINLDIKQITPHHVGRGVLLCHKPRKKRVILILFCI